MQSNGTAIERDCSLQESEDTDLLLSPARSLSLRTSRFPVAAAHYNDTDRPALHESDRDRYVGARTTPSSASLSSDSFSHTRLLPVGAAVGGALGASIGAMYGTYEAIRYKVPGLYKIRYIGQTTVSSAAVFGLFLGAGSLLHCGRR